MNQTSCRRTVTLSATRCAAVCGLCLQPNQRFDWVLECVITADCGRLYCTQRVNEEREKRGGSSGSPQMNLLDDMLFGKPYPRLFEFLSSARSELLSGFQDQSLSLCVSVVKLQTHDQLVPFY